MKWRLMVASCYRRPELGPRCSDLLGGWAGARRDSGLTHWLNWEGWALILKLFDFMRTVGNDLLPTWEAQPLAPA